jgi:hypothetical protein
LQGCNVIDAALIAPVPVAHRPEAIAELENVAITELDQGQMLTLLDLPSDPSTSGASRINAAIAILEEQRRIALEDRIGSWPRAYQERLDGLHHLDADPSTATLRPFLVRAVAKNEGSGAFSASACKDGLVIYHGSLGHWVPPSTRLPIVVFLDHVPARVFISWWMAE